MSFNLLATPLEKLLKKFGRGNHKPGSGSAAALQGLLASQLILTVIELSLSPKRNGKYDSHKNQLTRIQKRIQKRLYPRLAELFELDSVEFDKVIKLRDLRDNETNELLKSSLKQDELKQLKVATEIPIEIAGICCELAKMAIFVVDFGFQSAGGDSNVALNSSISAVAGSISIIHLNLTSFDYGQWPRSTRKRTQELQIKYDDLSSEMNKRIIFLRNKANNRTIINTLAAMKTPGPVKKLKDSEIESRVNYLHAMMWDFRSNFWSQNPPQDKISTLDPKIAIEKLKYIYKVELSLGIDSTSGKIYEIAGLINMEKKEISISQQFSLDVQNFTAAHELGHALLHNQTVMHRDRPVDGVSKREKREIEEKQADRFAVFFLMPANEVKVRFEETFGAKSLSLNQDTAILLNKKDYFELKNLCTKRRDFSRVIASAETIANTSKTSLAKQFNVSVEAMAIRLEELKLIEF